MACSWGAAALLVAFILPLALASPGDNIPFFNKCWRSCIKVNCTDDGESYKPELNILQPVEHKLLLWKCTEECQYDCMWKTVDAFEKRGWQIPQFFGKWPFIRVLGIQEVGSVIGSVLNLFSHIINYRSMKKHIRKTNGLFWLWQVFAMVCVNAWFWSIVFHTRDTYFTEFMDYACAFSMVVIVFYCFGMRVLYGKPKLWGVMFSCLCASYYINHVVYLYSEKIDYGYNMVANVSAGFLGGLGWFIWCSVQLWRGRLYVWRCLAFVVLTAASMLLELSDFPPLFHFWDAHALWHVSTAPLPFLFYRFIIDDCSRLRKRME
ncbi:per1-like protein PGAP3 [Arctopsyche grandis]|uniref:per1-like protein PGAP3 n=1 Tax=Arctopsyche grandis TaxID=121162 RepID=UPI00406D93B2